MSLVFVLADCVYVASMQDLVDRSYIKARLLLQICSRALTGKPSTIE